MCNVCTMSVCDTRCPEAEPVFDCARCREGIFKGEKYFDSPRGTICMECLSEMTAEEILETVGENLTMA